ncbi:DDE-type integrase/transposase/recombinase [Amycolatopsis jiangsuensis]|uniref:Integrase catalytic domain-containing protein n=1 Tax=Amycolatopsis jiangsuensis TaxID=1181879 RepID=A0A840J761_9PSEU|nr:DDE-type integrase/transposase/recombinase [Amycolatopsis jiangsuensis]MBB4689549.1 hypothetical protein [Amycolatopsis jiangsuensis]
MFLCAIRDGHSRKVLGYSVSDHIGVEMVADAVDDAAADRSGRCRGTILHSDRGGEFTAHLTHGFPPAVDRPPAARADAARAAGELLELLAAVVKLEAEQPAEADEVRSAS